ncbi:MAG TPA: class I SAM-dependent methyltransferase [Thermoleophilaceae bacterium]|jgi:SAM-dependent methyltransferase
MTTTDNLKRAFSYGYDSGDVLARLPDKRRRQEQRLIRGSYRRFFRRGVLPHLEESSTVLELGPGRGSWTRALLKSVPRGQVHTVDFQDVTDWLPLEDHGGRLVHHRVEDNSFEPVPDGMFDLFFSFGVLCHNTTQAIGEIMRNALPKMRPGGIAVHQYGDWDKLEKLGWDDDRHGVQAAIRGLPDDAPGNFWPRNDPERMSAVCRAAGWIVEEADLGLFERDSAIRLRAPAD